MRLPHIFCWRRAAQPASGLLIVTIDAEGASAPAKRLFRDNGRLAGRRGRRALAACVAPLVAARYWR
jgi:hypothetical protein